MSKERAELIARLFPGGIPKLFCPPLTNFNGRMHIDRERMIAHYASISQYVGGFLIPGSTGDGWLMDDEMMLDVLSLARGYSAEHKGGVLAAVLKPALHDMLAGIERVRDIVQSATGRRDTDGFIAAGLKGVTVCAPTGEGRTQSEIEAALKTILDLGLPTALYQLPQITQNEIGPDVLERLALQYPHFYMFKDTSGHDAAALSDADFDGVHLVRGAEGGYARWYKGCGGPYDGFLLSTANGFAPELRRILAYADDGKIEEAYALSDKLDELVTALFDMVASISVSNAFANAARIIDHLRAYGRAWAEASAPCLPDGSGMDADILAAGIARVQAMGVTIESGYLG